MTIAEHPSAQVDQTSKAHGRFSGFSGVFLSRSTSVSSLYELEEGDSGWTVRDVETGIFGAGASDADALRDYVLALHEHRDVLERQDALSDDLARQLAYVKRVLG